MLEDVPQLARDVYNIEHWSEGFFDVDDQGSVVVCPDENIKVSLTGIAEKISKENLALPVLVRFPAILHNRVKSLSCAFEKACKAYLYNGTFTSVYPIKVNQQRRVVEELIHGQLLNGQNIGLEAGSKPELMAVLAMAHSPGATIICNGYKDSHYIRLALMGEKLGHKVYLVIEKESELQLILHEAKLLDVKPRLGIRTRLSSIGKGNWQNTGGEKSKFGLNSSQILRVIEALKQAGELPYLQLLHFHLGSQIANIRDIQSGLKECARLFHEFSELGVNVDTVDVGGGLGVDYEGTGSRNYCSMNYSLQEYAHNVVQAFSLVCQKNNLKHPNIITESGRALTAHHAVLLTNVIDREQAVSDVPLKPEKQDDGIVHHLWQIYEKVQKADKRSLLEIYHDVQHDLSDAQGAFIHGTLSLPQRAKIETLAAMINKTLLAKLAKTHKSNEEVLQNLQEKMADKLFVNFSLFQSLPDIWGIDQIFPILPLTQLNQAVACRAVIQDITCDSDGRVDLYVDGEGIETTLPMPEYQNHKDILLGFFMVGAYQEILGDMHNLFGDTNSVDVYIDQQGQVELKHAIEGDTVSGVLEYVNFDIEEIQKGYKKNLEQSDLSLEQQQLFLNELVESLSAYTYLLG
ncbi:MAG: biosynthetic arginine decarboxylase [Bermanella sp.]